MTVVGAAMMLLLALAFVLALAAATVPDFDPTLLPREQAAALPPLDPAASTTRGAVLLRRRAVHALAHSSASSSQRCIHATTASGE